MHLKALLREEVHSSERLGFFHLEDYKELKVPEDLSDHPQTILLWAECLSATPQFLC